MNIIVELVVIEAFLKVIKLRVAGTLKPLKSFASVVNVNDLEVMIEYEKVLRGIDSMSNESLLDEGMSNRVGAIRMMFEILAEILNVWGPSIRIIDGRIGRLGWRNRSNVAVDLGFLPVGNEHIIPSTFI